MVQASALLAAIALTVTVPSAQAMDAPTCAEIREVAKQYTPAQLRAMAKRAKLTPEQWAAIKQCLEGK